MTLDRRDYKSAIPQLESRLAKVEQFGDKALYNLDTLADKIRKQILEEEKRTAVLDTSMNTLLVQMFYALVPENSEPDENTEWSTTMPSLDSTTSGMVLWYKSATYRNGIVVRETLPQTVEIMDGVFSFVNTVSGDNGWTTIDGDTIQTGVITSHNGYCYFDLDNNNFQMKDASTYGSSNNALVWDGSPNGGLFVKGTVEFSSASEYDGVPFSTILNNIQEQIDGNITTWFYNYAPTLSNEPAVNWTTTTDKDNHLGDLFYDTSTGYAYRFLYENNIYSWVKITDADITEALRLAQAAQDTADSKRRVFTTTPTIPSVASDGYDVGDLWAQGSTGDLYRCKTAKTSTQSYSASDWELATKYTDDTTADQAKDIATGASNNIADTRKYFWTDGNGAHVTKKSKDEFLSNPEYGNVLMGSSSVDVKTGDTVEASFGSTTTIGRVANGQSRTVISSSGVELKSRSNNADKTLASFTSSAVTVGDGSSYGAKMGDGYLTMYGAETNATLTATNNMVAGYTVSCDKGLSANGYVVTNSGFKIYGHDSTIGSIISVEGGTDYTSDLSSGTNTNKNIASISLTKGTWIVNCRARWTPNSGSSGANTSDICFSSTSASSAIHDRRAGTSDDTHQHNLTSIVTVASSTETWYLSGSASKAGDWKRTNAAQLLVKAIRIL